MISEARGLVMIAPWIVLFPALAIGIIVVAVNVLADGLGAKGSKRESRYL
jgi:ABC-type dipeptide/oligopeptide/nickel transport system permease subunit